MDQEETKRYGYPSDVADYHHHSPRPSIHESAGQWRENREWHQPRQQHNGSNFRIAVGDNAHDAEPCDEVKPVTKFRDNLAPPQSPERAIGSEKLKISQ